MGPTLCLVIRSFCVVKFAHLLIISEYKYYQNNAYEVTSKGVVVHLDCQNKYC